MAEIIEEADFTAMQVETESKADQEGYSTDQTVIHHSGTITAPLLNEENLTKAFALFADLQKISLVSLIKILIPSINNKLIQVSLTKQQDELIGEIRINWQGWLKTHFNDAEITLQFLISETADTKRKAYTASEQFEELLNENELFRKMVNQFKLKLKQ